MADATDKLLKTLREPRTSIKQPETPVGTTNAGEGFFLPNYSGIREQARIKSLTSDTIYCSKIVGV